VFMAKVVPEFCVSAAVGSVSLVAALRFALTSPKACLIQWRDP